MGVYDRQVAMAERLIRTKGKPITVVRQTTTTTVGKPWEVTAPTEVRDDGHAVFLNFSQKDLETQSATPGISEVTASDRKVLLAAAAFIAPPTRNDQLEDANGVRWSIEWVQELAPNGENILYMLRARR